MDLGASPKDPAPEGLREEEEEEEEEEEAGQPIILEQFLVQRYCPAASHRLTDLIAAARTIRLRSLALPRCMAGRSTVAAAECADGVVAAQPILP